MFFQYHLYHQLLKYSNKYFQSFLNKKEYMSLGIPEYKIIEIGNGVNLNRFNVDIKSTKNITRKKHTL